VSREFPFKAFSLALSIELQLIGVYLNLDDICSVFENVFFFGKVVFFEVNEFHGLHDDLKIK